MLESLLVWAIVITFATLTLLARRYPTAFGQASKKVTDLALLLLALVGIMSYRDLRSWTHILQYKLQADSTATLGSAAATIEAMDRSGLWLQRVGGVGLVVILTLGVIVWYTRHRSNSDAEAIPGAQHDS